MGHSGTPTACPPFGNDSPRASKSLRLEATPQVGAITMTSGPLNIEPWQVVLERALAHPEHVGSLTSQHPADEAPAMAGEPYDLLYGDARLSLFEDSRVGVFSPKITLILNALGGGQ